MEILEKQFKEKVMNEKTNLYDTKYFIQQLKLRFDTLSTDQLIERKTILMICMMIIN